MAWDILHGIEYKQVAWRILKGKETIEDKENKVTLIGKENMHKKIGEYSRENFARASTLT